MGFCLDKMTRQAVVSVLKENCVVRSLKKGKECPNYGLSGTCVDCVHSWVTVAHRVGDLIGSRRARYEGEQKKRKKAECELRGVEAGLKKLASCMHDVVSESFGCRVDGCEFCSGKEEEDDKNKD